MKTISKIMAEASFRVVDKPREERVHQIASDFPWKYRVFHPALAPILPAAIQWVSDFIFSDCSPYWLSILGPSGIGKTFILKQAMACALKGRSLHHQRTGREPSIERLQPQKDLGDWKAAKDYSEYDVIYVEDVACMRSMDKGASAILTDRIAELLQLRARKWTLICANLSREEIARQIDPRIASRMTRDGSVCIEIPTEVPDFNS